MSSTSDYDIIIIGARVAGSTLAASLGEKGYRILILDRSTFPSDTISTHFFRAPALRAFKKIGVYTEIQSVAPHLKVNCNVIDGIEFSEPVDRPEDYPFYMCVRRIILDEILIRRIKQFPNIELRVGVNVKQLLWNNDYVTGIVWEDSKQRREERAKVIVGADGINSFLAKEINAQAEHKEPVNRAMYYAYYRGIKAKKGPAAEFHFKGNTLAYCFPCDSNLTIVAISIPIIQFTNFKRNLKIEFNNLLNSMSGLAQRITDADLESPIRGSGNIPGYLRIPYGNGWALVGDAGMVMDPWSGQGIDQASTHALFLANYLDNYMSGRQKWKTAMHDYHNDRNEFSLKIYHRTCKFSVDLRPMTKEALKRRGL